MKKILALTLVLFASLSAFAQKTVQEASHEVKPVQEPEQELVQAPQTMAEECAGIGDEWARAFSAEGRKSWKPEFTVRYSTGFLTEGPAVTAGVRIDEKRTLGVMVGKGETFIDKYPTEYDCIQTCVYKRRYFHLGKHNLFAFYSDLAIGAGWVYSTNVVPEYEQAVPQPGDVEFYAAWNPGVRVRIYKNIHLFLGPTISTNCIGIHLGAGF